MEFQEKILIKYVEGILERLKYTRPPLILHRIVHVQNISTIIECR